MALTAGLPPNVVDLLALAQASSGKPLVRLVQQAAQSIATGTDVAITFGAGCEDIDTRGFHGTATSSSRITPTVAGYYRLTGTVWWAADTDIVSLYAGLGKSGNFLAPRQRIVLPSTTTASASRSVFVTAILSANGSTDYFELLSQQTQAAAGSLSTAAAGSSSSVFECEFLRPL